MGGDGMQIQIDKRNPNIVFWFQFGNYYRIDRATNKRSTFRRKKKDENHFVSIGKHLFYCLHIKIFCIWDPIFLLVP
jgi:hypothetical protein